MKQIYKVDGIDGVKLIYIKETRRYLIQNKDQETYYDDPRVAIVNYGVAIMNYLLERATRKVEEDNAIN